MSRARSALAAVPRPLALVAAASVLLGLCWALFVPGGQSPDEPVHVAYVQVLAERLGLPQPDTDDPSEREQGFSTEQRLARDRSRQQWQFFEPKVKPPWWAQDEREWLAEQARLGPEDRADGGGPSSAYGNPPTYYGYEALAYLAAGGHFFDRLFAMRMWSALLLVVAVAGTWLALGELTARNRLAQLVGAGVVGLQPMATFVSSSINPDAGLIALWALVLWLGVKLLREPPRRSTAIALGAVTVAALLTKATSVALVVAVGFALLVVARRVARQRGLTAQRLALYAAAGVALAAAAAVGTVGRLGAAARFGVNDLIGFASYMWQAYLPNLPFQEALPGLAAFAGYDIWIRSGWAAFGWLEIQFPEPVYALLFVVSLALVGGGLWAIWRGRFPVDRPVLAFLGLLAAVTVLALHWAEFRQFTLQGQSFIQGRYLLPLLPLGGILTAAALSNLPGRWRGAGAALVLGGLLVLQLFSLGLIAVRFYV